MPDGADLVVLPEAFARDFGEPGSDLAPYAEPLDGPFVTEVERVADRARHDGRRRDVRAGRPARRTTPWSCAAARTCDYRKIHLYDSFGYRESDVLAAGPIEPAIVRARRHDGRPDDLLRPALPRARARASSTRGAEVLVVPAAWVAGPRKVDHWRTLLRARAIENTVYVVGVGQPGAALHRPLDGRRTRSATCWSRAATTREILTAELDLGAVAEARRTNPSLANRRL